jgi:hypothetical protein
VEAPGDRRRCVVNWVHSMSPDAKTVILAVTGLALLVIPGLLAIVQIRHDARKVQREAQHGGDL